MIDLIERLELGAERVQFIDRETAAACRDAAAHFRGVIKGNRARALGRTPSPIGRLRRRQKYALELMARFNGPCPVTTDEPTTVVDEIPRINWNTAVSLQRHGLIRLNEPRTLCRLTKKGAEAAAYAARYARPPRPE